MLLPSSEERDGHRNPEFPFMNLPPELRHMVWCLYCRELRVKGRVLHFLNGTMRENSSLWSETKCVRTMMAVHKESRGIGLLAFPKTISIQAGEASDVVRFNPLWDVISLTALNFDPCGFLEVENLCVPSQVEWSNPSAQFVFKAELECLPNLKRAFVNHFVEEPPLEVMQRRHSGRFHLHRHGGYIARNRISIWPNLVEYPELAAALPETPEITDEDLASAQEKRVSWWPLYTTATFEDIPAHEIWPYDRNFLVSQS